MFRSSKQKTRLLYFGQCRLQAYKSAHSTGVQGSMSISCPGCHRVNDRIGRFMRQAIDAKTRQGH
jgi:hypothetical protein